MGARKKFYWGSLIILLIFSGCGEFAPQARKKKKKRQTTTEKLKPSKENTFEELMEKSGHNINYILYGLLNYDEIKVKRGGDNIVLLCKLMMGRLPSDVLQDSEEKKRWEVTYKEQGEIAQNIKYRFEELNYAAARREMKNLLRNCMFCHKEITGIPKAELTFIGARDPSMEMALTQVMDSCNINFDDLLFGLIAHDMEELAAALENIKRTSTLMMHKIPDQYQVQKDKWDTYCKDQRDVAIRLKEKIKADQVEEIWNGVEDLLKACMDCHKLYRPGIK